ncbi:MAG: class I SAM-dependent methyltransferase [Clostridiaceae bacterium]|nr:class I SAM-dependent methyltransferase [Clostridiaceae bacterium]
MYDINYPAWADYIEKIFEKNNIKPKIIADLGCGTGSFCIEMCKRGYDMIGVDISEDMLSCALTKARKMDLPDEKLLLLNQDMTEFEFYGTVDAIVSLMDSVNYITNIKKLRKMFKLVWNYLNDNGLFIFDINSIYKFENILHKNTFHYIDDDITYIWQNNYKRKNKTCQFDITFFVKEEELFRRFDEIHYERAYSINELTSLASECSLEVINIYDFLTFNKPNSKSERIFFVLRKVS